MIYYQFVNAFLSMTTKNDQGGSGSVINWHHGSGSVIQDYGSKDPDPKEITAAPQHWSLSTHPGNRCCRRRCCAMPCSHH